MELGHFYNGADPFLDLTGNAWDGTDSGVTAASDGLTIDTNAGAVTIPDFDPTLDVLSLFSDVVLDTDTDAESTIFQ